jgi:hypothetical protein
MRLMVARAKKHTLKLRLRQKIAKIQLLVKIWTIHRVRKGTTFCSSGDPDAWLRLKPHPFLALNVAESGCTKMDKES